MSFFRSPSPAQQQVPVPSYTGLNIQTSSNALPVPIVYGASKVAPNFFWANNFQIGLAFGFDQSAGGGKGGGGGGGGLSVTGFLYFSGVMMGICEGPIDSVQCFWTGQSTTDAAGLGLSFFNGADPQATWNYLDTAYPAQAIAYNGVAYLAADSFDLGSSASLPSLSIECYGVLVRSGSNGIDADPALCIYDLLTNGQYGAGFPAASIDTATLFGASGDASYQTYCFASGLALSPALTDQEACSSIIARWLQLTNSAAVWSGGKLKFIPYGDDSVSGQLVSYPSGVAYVFSTDGTLSVATQNPTVEGATVTFTPNLTPLYNLTDDDFVAADDEDPVQVLRSDPYAAYNEQNLEIYQRSNFYDATPVTAFDQNAIDLYGLRIASTVTAHEICDPEVGQVAAQLILQRGLYIRRTYKFKLSWEYCLLEPMDLVTLTDPAIGLNNTAVRITSIAEDEDGLLEIEAEEFPGGIATAVKYPVQSKVSSGIAANAAAGPVNPPVFIEPPYQLASGLYVYIGVSGVDTAVWRGANVYVSADNVSYSLYGKLTGAATMGAATGDFPAIAAALTGTTVDNTNVLGVDLGESNGALDGVSQTAMLAASSACYLGSASGGEIVAFQNATLTAANQYDLSPLLRGAFGSTIADHPAGSPFVKLDQNVFQYPYLASQVGQTVYFKFQSFNGFGGGLQNLADCVAYPYLITGSALAAPLPVPQNLQAGVYNSQFEQLNWDEITDFRSGIRYKISKGASLASAIQVGDVAHPPFTLFGADTYYVQAYCNPAIGISVISGSNSLAVTGNMLTANILVSKNQQAEGWPGTLTNLTPSGVAPDQILNLVGLGQGIYEIPLGDDIDIGYVDTVTINVSWLAAGAPTADNFLGQSSVLNNPDILGAAATASVTAYPEISIGLPQTSSDIFASPDTFQNADVFSPSAPVYGAWQKFVPGTYQGRYFKLRMVVVCASPLVTASLTGFAYTINRPARIDHYQDLAVPSTGLTIAFTPDNTSAPAAFNGGPNGQSLPYINIAWSQQPGDTAQITGLSKSQVTIQIFNGGTAVARTGVNLDAEGY